MMRLAIATWCSLLAFPALAAASGVLIGLRDSNNAYRTIWIVADESGPVVSAIVKGLVIPRETGLWRIDVERMTCGEIGQYLVDELRIGPLDSDSGAPPTPDCEAIAKAYCEATYPTGGDLIVQHWLSYAGPTHFAEAFRSIESCGLYPVENAGYSVHEVDHPEEDVPMQTVFAGDRMDALQASAREALVCGTDDLDCIDSLDRYRVSASSGWGIVRADNQWSVLVSVLPPGPGRARPWPVVTGLRPPASILGLSESEDTATVSEALPEGDPSVSPDRDMAIIRTDRVAAYRLVAGTVTGPPVVIPTGSDEQVVMIEWVSGSQVEPWDGMPRGLSR